MTKTNIPKILVVDDDPDIVSLLSIQLKKKGYQVIEAQNGAEALVLVQKEKPDLIILDVMMPEKNGWEVAREVRRDPGFSSTKILMLTGIGDHLNELTSPLYGASDYLNKPFHVEHLERKVAELVGIPRF